MKRILRKQHDATDCGAACLSSVAAYYNLEVPIARIRQYAHTGMNGTNVYGLIQAAGKLGFDAKGVRGDARCLEAIPRPAIAHLTIDTSINHYVVLYKINQGKVLIMDPAEGILKRWPLREFTDKWTGIMVLLTPGMQFLEGQRGVPVWKRFWVLLQPHKQILAQAFMGALAYTLLGFSTSLYLQKLADFVFVGGNTRLLNLLSIAMIVLLVFQTAIGSFKDVYLIRTGQLIDMRLILGYYKHLMKLPQPFFDTMRVGEILSRISDAMKIRNFISNVALNLALNAMIVSFSFGLMFALYWQLALIMLSIIPLYTAIYFLANYLNSKTERNVMEAAASLESQLVESLNIVKTIKHFGLETHTNLKTETQFIGLLRNGYRSGLNQIFTLNSTAFISALFTIILLWSGSYFVIKKTITPGELLSFYAILGYFTGPVSRLIHANKEIQKAMIAADRLFDIMDLEREDHKEELSIQKIPAGDILFKNVSFRYGNRPPVFEGLDLQIRQGKQTAIIGESGAGKSSLVHILQRLYPIQDGKICLGNTDLEYLNTEALRNHIAIVPQEIQLFNGTIMENIALGSFHPDTEMVMHLCRTLGLLGFIEGLPQGFHTQLGENGALLSGGQKQRIAIARALYKKPQILIMDEATAALDNRSECYIRIALNKLKLENKTVILISHRLSSVVSADTIILLHAGAVLEEGSHSELYAKKEHYYRLWQQHPPSILPL